MGVCSGTPRQENRPHWFRGWWTGDRDVIGRIVGPTADVKQERGARKLVFGQRTGSRIGLATATGMENHELGRFLSITAQAYKPLQDALPRGRGRRDGIIGLTAALGQAPTKTRETAQLQSSSDLRSENSGVRRWQNDGEALSLQPAILSVNRLLPLSAAAPPAWRPSSCTAHLLLFLCFLSSTKPYMCIKRILPPGETKSPEVSFRAYAESRPPKSKLRALQFGILPRAVPPGPHSWVLSTHIFLW
ncbi:hypothetical protein DBR06_SOUSAS3110038 [Sousa chinensis]|nr:hypothetical protein DBR06_SOUSAS3110038 [Sousa chinensis]